MVVQVREGCFVVDTAPFKATVEAHAAAALAALGHAMHESASRAVSYTHLTLPTI